MRPPYAPPDPIRQVEGGFDVMIGTHDGNRMSELADALRALGAGVSPAKRTWHSSEPELVDSDRPSGG